MLLQLQDAVVRVVLVHLIGEGASALVAGVTVAGYSGARRRAGAAP
jgi:hypothetical protein